jgi:hypothetical protein
VELLARNVAAMAALRQGGVTARGEAGRMAAPKASCGAGVLGVQIHNIPAEVTVTVAIAAIAAAMLRGDTPLRAVALAILWQVVTVPTHVFRWGHPWPNDLMMLALTGICALRGAGYWSVWAAAASILSLATDGIRLVAPFDDWAFASANMVWFYVQMAAVIFGSLAGRGGAVRIRPSKSADAADDVVR